MQCHLMVATKICTALWEINIHTLEKFHGHRILKGSPINHRAWFRVHVCLCMRVAKKMGVLTPLTHVMFSNGHNSLHNYLGDQYTLSCKVSWSSNPKWIHNWAPRPNFECMCAFAWELLKKHGFWHRWPVPCYPPNGHKTLHGYPKDWRIHSCKVSCHHRGPKWIPTRPKFKCMCTLHHASGYGSLLMAAKLCMDLQDINI